MRTASNTPLPALLLGAAAAVALTGCSVSLDLDESTTRRVENLTVPADGLSLVDVHTGNGAVEIVGGSGDDVEIRAIMEESDEGDASFTVENVGDRLVVRGECDSGWLDRCQVGFGVTVPNDLDVSIDTSNGRIVIDGAVGDVEVETDNGAIDGEQIAAKRVVARTDNGRIDMVFDDAPETVDLATDNGAIRVRVPDDDAVYEVDASSGNGSIDIEVPTDPSADRRIIVESDNGSIDVGLDSAG